MYPSYNGKKNGRMCPQDTDTPATRLSKKG